MSAVIEVTVTLDGFHELAAVLASLKGRPARVTILEGTQRRTWEPEPEVKPTAPGPQPGPIPTDAEVTRSALAKAGTGIGGLVEAIHDVSAALRRKLGTV